MRSLSGVGEGGLIVDSIHGDVHLTKQEREVLDTASFQRLRHIKQLGMGHVTYPNATHTRFAHSIGVLAIMGRVVGLAPDKLILSDDTAYDLRLAALLHDIGHYPYSHLVEKLHTVRLTDEIIKTPHPSGRSLDFSGKPFPHHETLGRLVVTSQPDLLEALGGLQRAKHIADIFTRTDTETLQLSKLIHSSLDMDRLDYLRRDSQATGVPYGEIDANYLLNQLKVSPRGMVGVGRKALPAAEHSLFARFFMYRAVYRHKTTFGIEEACRQLLRRIHDKGWYDFPQDGQSVEGIARGPKLGTFTDAYVDGIVQKAAGNQEDEVIAALATSIRHRKPPKLLREVDVYTKRDTKYHAGAAFRQDCALKLADLAKEVGIPMGLFLLCETPPLTLEERPARVSADEARELPAETEEELIKVFVEGEEEPVSIVDLPESVLHEQADYFFQSVRLYVVLNETNREQRAKDLRERVRDWGRA